MADELDILKMKVADLKKELKERGLSTVGAKSELFDRLKSALSSTADPDALLEETDESIDLNNSNVLTSNITEPNQEVSVPTVQTVSKDDDTTSRPAKTESTEEEHTEHVKVTLSCPTDSQRLKKRAERFGVINEDIKKQQRAERFGMPSTGSGKLSTAGAGPDVDILKKRAERFGQVVSSSLSKVDEDERIRKRKDRFGDVTATANNTPTKTTTNTPSKFAKITFGSPKEDDKKKKRAERFGLV